MEGDRRPAVFRFGVFELDERSGEVRKNGRQVRLRGRPFDILVLLLRANGAIVTRDDLRQQLWTAETFVDFDHGLNTAVNRLREALGDSAESPRFIETLPRRGYRFIAPISLQEAVPPVAAPAPAASPVLSPPPVAVLQDRPVSAEVAPAPAARPTGSVSPRTRTLPRPAVTAIVAVGLVAVALYVARERWTSAAPGHAGKVTIAVLPFANLSGDQAQEYLSDGFTEELIAELGRLQPGRLAVVARTTIMQYKETRKTVGDIGRELGVEYVLEGSVRRAAGRLRITAQLVQTSDQTNLWSDSYERAEADALTIQSEVAGRIADTLAMRVLPAESGQPRRLPGSFPAYEYVLRGRFFREQATEASTRKAIEYFQRAIDLDPTYALAHAGLADAYRLLAAPGWEVEQPSTLLARAKAEAEQALRLGPELAEPYAAAAMVKFTYDWDLPGAEADLQRAIKLNPSFAQAHQYYSGVLTTMQRPDDAIREARIAFELDPLSRTASTTLGVRLYYAGQYDAAAEQFRKTLEVSPTFAVAHWGLAETDRMKGRLQESVESLRHAVEYSGSSSYMRAWLGHALALAGRRAEAQEILAAFDRERPRQYVSPFHYALVYAGLGENDRAIQALEQSFADGSGWMVYLRVENEFEHLRHDPRYVRLLGRIQRPQ